MGHLSAMLDDKMLPIHFPIQQWNQQAVRYMDYWKWYRGDYLAEVAGLDANGQPVAKYPLQINSIRNFARKYAGVVLGEDNYDSTQPQIRTMAIPRNPMTGENPSEQDKQLAKTFENIVNSVWQCSQGRAIQTEGVLLSQFLGGTVFKVKWSPHLIDELPIPITIEHIAADHFMPVWTLGNYYKLQAAYVVYRIPAVIARQEYEYQDLPGVTHSLYVEHWTDKEYSIFLDGKPLKSKADGTVYDHLPNPFGFVPFVYMPARREGSFYGSSFIPDVAGLVKEYNARLANVADVVIMNIKRRRYMTNVGKNIRERTIGTDTPVIDLGSDFGAAKHPPAVEVEDPPAMSDPLVNFVSNNLWRQLVREADLPDIAFGEDEGSQRSALTLAFRMYPLTTRARITRAFWTEGMSEIAKMIGRMMVAKADVLKDMGVQDMVPLDFAKRLEIGVDWRPMIPRDREQMVNEAVLFTQANIMSPQRAIELSGNVRNVQDELKLIEDFMKFKASLEAKSKPAAEKVNSPVAESITGDG